MKKVADYLKNTPKGTKLYSPVCGDVYLEEVSENTITLKSNQEKIVIFNGYGCYHTYADNYQGEGECLLFPSKVVRNWRNYSVFHNFKPFDKVVVRDEGFWHIDFFEKYVSDDVCPYVCMHQIWQYCLPFNEETAKLIGTKDDYE